MRRRIWGRVAVLCAVLVGVLLSCEMAQAVTSVGAVSSTVPVDQPYNIGAPHTRTVWVDPRRGSDHHSGATRATAYRTLTAAWNAIPERRRLKTGVLIRILPGTLGTAAVPNYLESRWGTHAAPIMIEPAGAPGSVSLAALNIYDTHYLYLVGLRIASRVGDSVHCERCDHFLLRDSTLTGVPPASGAVEEVVKLNQSSWVWIEQDDISGGTNNALDLVAVQHAQISANRLHDAGDWCAYAKGGSAYVRVSGNELFDCGVGGFTAGQGSGMQFMQAPWLGYEAYDVKVVDNVVHDVSGAAFGVNGGYDVLIAWNTAWRTGSADHIIEVVAGHRSCDGQVGDADRAGCAQNLALGGWGTTRVDDGENYVRIPDRHVYIYDNLLANPPGVASASTQFAIAGPWSGASQDGSGVPSPARADDDLQIRGNVIANGTPDLPLGVAADQGADSAGCADDNPTCNAAELTADNAIGTLTPQLAAPDSGLFSPTNAADLIAVTRSPIPAFGWSDVDSPKIPAGTLSNDIPLDRAGHPRSAASPPGAYAS